MTLAEAEFEKLSPDALAESLTGFEEIAIRQFFRTKLEDLAEDSTMMMRALLFVVYKRDGMKDADAFQTAMHESLSSVVEKFERSNEDDPDPQAQAEHDKAYADFVVGVGVSFMPNQYNELTLSQRTALIAAANRR